jgi:hypothetical protein
MPCSELKVNSYFGGTLRLHPQDRRINQVGHQHEEVSKTEITCSSETSVEFQLSTGCYIPEDKTQHKLLFKNSVHTD